MESWAQPLGPAGKVLTVEIGLHSRCRWRGSSRGPTLWRCCHPSTPCNGGDSSQGTCGVQARRRGSGRRPPSLSLWACADEWGGRRGLEMGRVQGPWPHHLAPSVTCLNGARVPQTWAPWGARWVWLILVPAPVTVCPRRGIRGVRYKSHLRPDASSSAQLRALPPLPAAGLIRAFAPFTGRPQQHPQFYPLCCSAC